MAVKLITIENEGKVRQYTCLPTDAKSTYPTDCAKGSKMTILNAITGLPNAELIYDGAKFVYANPIVRFEDGLDILDVAKVVADYPLNLLDAMSKRFKFKVDAVAVLTSTFYNVPRDCKFEIIVECTATPTSLTFPVAVKFAVAPTFTSGKTYIIEVETFDGGTSYLARATEY